MAMTPFLWGKNGEQLTPQQVERRRIAALLASQRASDTSPVGHWTQAAARGLSGFMAGRGERFADDQENAGLAGADQRIQGDPVLSALMGGQQMAAPVQPGMAPAQPMAEGMPSGGLPASIIQSESGGNWNALNSEGYGGRGQFGEARLADAARAGVIPAGMDGAAYSQAAPQVQTAVENWHKQDILSSLGQYVGVDPDGPGPIPALTPDSLLAVAHLGGTGGARRFVESGGQYNPADSNGTSLADYAIRHAGGPQAGAMPQGMMGNTPQAPSGVVAALAAAQSDPWVAQKYGPVINALMDQEMGRQDASYQQQMAQQDPMYQAQLQAAQIANQQAMMPQAQKPIEVGGVLLDPTTYQPIFDSREPDAYTLGPGQQRFDAQGNVIAQGPEAQPGVVVNNMPGQDKFDEAFASGDAAALATISDAGISAQRNIGRIDQLESLLQSSPTGFSGVAKQRLGELGINTAGLDDIQAAQALVNTLVPEQRPPGSGPMSDADLELFKQSLPRIVNQPGGNATIIQTMRGIAQYDAQGAQIVQQVRDGSMTRAQGFAALQARPNPLETFKAPPGTAVDAAVSQPATGGATSFSGMAPADLLKVDINSLSDAELDAYLEATSQ